MDSGSRTRWPLAGTRWNPGTRQLVGAAGFEHAFAEAPARKPAAPCAQERGLAMSCDVMRKAVGLKFLNSNDLAHVIAGHRAHTSRSGTPLEPRRGPTFWPVPAQCPPFPDFEPNRPSRVAPIGDTRILDASSTWGPKRSRTRFIASRKGEDRRDHRVFSRTAT